MLSAKFSYAAGGEVRALRSINERSQDLREGEQHNDQMAEGECGGGTLWRSLPCGPDSGQRAIILTMHAMRLGLKNDTRNS
jgi:hypothetical protein